jgi:hypothetical protein
MGEDFVSRLSISRVSTSVFLAQRPRVHGQIVNRTLVISMIAVPLDSGTLLRRHQGLSFAFQQTLQTPQIDR